MNEKWLFVAIPSDQVFCFQPRQLQSYVIFEFFHNIPSISIFRPLKETTHITICANKHLIPITCYCETLFG